MMDVYTPFIDFNSEMPEPTYSHNTACFKNVKWARNHPCTITSGKLYVTPTNFQNISYLNLEEFTFDARASGFYGYPEHVADTCRLRRVRNIYSLASCRSDHDIRDEIAAYAEFEYTNRALSRSRTNYNSYLKYESDRKACLSWDCTIMNCRCKKPVDLSKAVINIVSTRYLRDQWKVLAKRFRNSKAFVHCFRTILSNDRCRQIIRQETNFFYYIESFLSHSYRAGSDGRTFLYNIYTQEYLFGRHSPFKLAFWEKDCEGLRLYLDRLIEQNIPLMLSWIISELAPDVNAVWPYLRYGASDGYMYSNDFIIRLIFDFACVHYQKFDEDFSDRIRTVWRAIPTPLVTLKFLDVILQFVTLAFGNNTPEYYLISNAKFMEVYPADCIAQTKEPRALQHLARCAIRQKLNTPLGVSFDSMPTRLRDYVNLKC